jgi:uncharacterized protein YdaU (DUF1376 family)
MKRPSFQFYPADYLSDMQVRLLPWASKGVYMDLICYCWREGWIPSDSTAIAQLCGCHDLAIIEPCLALFQIDESNPSRLIHKRLNEEKQKQDDFISSKSNSGKKGAKARWNKEKKALNDCFNDKDLDDGTANGTAIVLPMAKNGSSSSTATSSSNNIPPNPQGGISRKRKTKLSIKQTVTENDEIMKRINSWFGRRPETKWTVIERDKFYSIDEEDRAEPQLDGMEQFYLAEETEGQPLHRRTSLPTLINNWLGELDKARKYARTLQ